MNKKSKIAALIGGALIVGATLGGAIMYNPINEVPYIVENTVIERVEVPTPFIVEKNVTIEVPFEVEKIVEVDNGDMAFLLERLEDKMLIEDQDEVVAEFKAEDEAIKAAFAFIDDNREDLFDMLEEEGLVNDEDDVEIVKVYNDFEDVIIVKSDFDDEEYEFQLKYKIEDTDEEVKSYILATVSIEDGEVELLSVQEE